MVRRAPFGEDFRAKAKVEGETQEEEWSAGRCDSGIGYFSPGIPAGSELPGLPTAFPTPTLSASPMKPPHRNYAAGCVRRPMGTASAAEDAAGAAMKLFSGIELTSQGAAVHPRAGDFTFPEILHAALYAV